MMRKLLEGKRIEWFALLVYISSFIIITVFHEPWFDEAEAWQIAKCASIKEILFDIPHYEGHPPLWHLILAIPAKLGVPFEIGLKSIGFVFSLASVSLILFRSKLPRLARLLLPFSYFIFYQYGIIVRPYCVMLLVMILLGMEFDCWNEHPWRVTGLLVFLCLTCAFGIVLAGGIAICLLWEIWQEKGIMKLLKGMFKDQRTQALLFLLLCAIIIIASLIPFKDTYSPTILEGNSFILCLLCALLTFPGECFLTTGSWFSVDRTLLQNVYISIPELISFCMIGLVIWFLLICVSSRRNLKLLLIPYVMFAIFAAKIYFSGHHLGNVFIFFLFWFEVQYRSGDCFEIGNIIVNIIAKSKRDKQLIHGLMIGVGCLGLLLPVFWTSVASINDLKMEYSFGRSAAMFIKEKGLQDRLILTDWNIQGSLFPQSEGNEDYINPYMAGTGAELSAYFSRNMALNLNNGNDHMAYTYHRLGPYEDGQRAKEQWREQGKPDIIIGKPSLELVYGDELKYSDYSLVRIIYPNYIWKAGYTYSSMPIYLRNDLISQYDVVPITGMEEVAFNGLQITEEMIEQYEQGVPVEEILKPYLDALFGEEK